MTAARLWAISDLHLGHGGNRQALQALEDHGQDWLIVAGDVGETSEQLAFACETLCARFAKVIWVPGNHELWTLPGSDQGRGVAKYHQLVAVCRSHGVLTPEDPWPEFPCSRRTVIAPLNLLYDYTFGPDDLTPAEAVAWAREHRLRCRDEDLLHPDPHPSRLDWCSAQCDDAEARLAELPSDVDVVLVNHFPLRRDLVRLPRIQRFIIWCGTRRTEDWHRRFPIRVVVSGHLHMRATDWIDGVRFEEVSLGYPRHWRQSVGVGGYLREILPGPPQPPGKRAGPIWYR